MADDLREWLSHDFDECMSLLKYADLSATPIRQINLPILQRMKFLELKEAGRLSLLDADDRLLVKLLAF